MRANEQRALPFYTSGDDEYRDDEYRESTPKKMYDIIVNLDKGLDETDLENLEDLSLPLPSVVYNTKKINPVLKSIATENRKIGQFLGTGSKRTDAEKKI